MINIIYLRMIFFKIIYDLIFIYILYHISTNKEINIIKI